LELRTRIALPAGPPSRSPFGARGVGFAVGGLCVVIGAGAAGSSAGVVTGCSGCSGCSGASDSLGVGGAVGTDGAEAPAGLELEWIIGGSVVDNVAHPAASMPTPTNTTATFVVDVRTAASPDPPFAMEGRCHLGTRQNRPSDRPGTYPGATPATWRAPPR
jgi:hypothetical protein